MTHTGSAERYCVLCHTRRGANKAQLKLSEHILALSAHSLDEVKDIGVWIVYELLASQIRAESPDMNAL